MDCRTTRERLSVYLDGELAELESGEVKDHLASCADCADEWEHLKRVDQELRQHMKTPEPAVPAAVWPAIEARLGEQDRPTQQWTLRRFQRPLALAASVALLVGVGTAGLVLINSSVVTARADLVDYNVLLNGITQDVNAAIERFLRHYQAVEISAAETRQEAPELHLTLPDELPGGFRLERVYQLRFGRHPGIAARYLRADEPLMLFFHPPMPHTRMGVHRESHCSVAGREGMRVEVGPWQLLHYTDPTTCHCLLSRLGTEAEQLAVLAAVAPDWSHAAEKQ